MPIQTDWVAMLLSLVVPTVIVAGLVAAALQPSSSWQETPGWAWGLSALIPLEGLRLFVMGMAQSEYQDYRGPRQTVVSFITATTVILGCLLIWILISMLLPNKNSSGLFDGVHLVVAMLSSPLFWQIMIVPLGFIVVDGALGLLLFRGDPQLQAARLDAINTTAGFWFVAALVWPAICGMAVVGILAVVSQRFADMVFPHLRSILFGYAALYFAGKAVLLAYLHTAHFLRTCRCPIWGEKQDVIDARRSVLFGVPNPSAKPVTLGEIMAQQRKAKLGK
jgi:hypothetical protein